MAITTAASVIIALTEAWEKGKINEGDLVVLAAFGSGFYLGKRSDSLVSTSLIKIIKAEAMLSAFYYFYKFLISLW